MKALILIVLFSLLGCNSNLVEDESQIRTSDMQIEIDNLLAKDAENKALEREYLEQIRIAQENNDTEAFEFYFQEYIDVERLHIPEELKKEPNYVEGGINIKY
tara:strand:- start:1176 stop:1484 length:309 start_codon:yes stop_codon:yes gene_type:complete